MITRRHATSERKKWPDRERGALVVGIFTQNIPFPDDNMACQGRSRPSAVWPGPTPLPKSHLPCAARAVQTRGASAQRRATVSPIRFFVPLCEEPHRAFGTAVQWREQSGLNQPSRRLARKTPGLAKQRAAFPRMGRFLTSLGSLTIPRGRPGFGPGVVLVGFTATLGKVGKASEWLVRTLRRECCRALRYGWLERNLETVRWLDIPEGRRRARKARQGTQNHTRPLAIRHGAPATWQIWFLEHCNMRRENGTGGGGGSQTACRPPAARNLSSEDFWNSPGW